MNVKTVFFKMSNELNSRFNVNPRQGQNRMLGKSIRQPDFLQFLKKLSDRCLPRGKAFDYALWGAFMGNDWSYTLYSDGNKGGLSRTDNSGRIRFRHPVATGQHGEVPFLNFRDAFLGGRGFRGTSPILTDVPNPLFSLIDHNSAHHMSYVLAQKAFRGSGNTSGWSIVVSFDQHTDYNDFTNINGIIDCQSWGQALRPTNRAVRTIDSPIAQYIVLGSGAGTACGRRWSMNGANVGPNVGLGNTTAILNHFFQARNLAGYDVYITVDRDFIKAGATPYPEQAFSATPVVGRKAVSDCLGFFKARNTNFVGFDVCGWPSTGVSVQLDQDIITYIREGDGTVFAKYGNSVKIRQMIQDYASKAGRNLNDIWRYMNDDAHFSNMRALITQEIAFDDIKYYHEQVLSY